MALETLDVPHHQLRMLQVAASIIAIMKRVANLPDNEFESRGEGFTHQTDLVPCVDWVAAMMGATSG